MGFRPFCDPVGFVWSTLFRSEAHGHDLPAIRASLGCFHRPSRSLMVSAGIPHSLAASMPAVSMLALNVANPAWVMPQSKAALASARASGSFSFTQEPRHSVKAVSLNFRLWRNRYSWAPRIAINTAALANSAEFFILLILFWFI